MFSENNNKDNGFDNIINHCLESIEKSVVHLINDANKKKAEQQIYNIVIGKTLVEQLSALDQNKATRLDYIEAEERAKNNARFITTIILSGIQANNFQKILNQSKDGFLFFYKKYFQP